MLDEALRLYPPAPRLDREAMADDEVSVGDAGQVTALFDQVRERFGGLDLLFNTAGVGTDGPFAEAKPENWRTQMDANLCGLLNRTHAAIPLLRGREGAMISRSRASRRPLLNRRLVRLQRDQVRRGRLSRLPGQGTRRRGHPGVGNRAGFGLDRMGQQRPEEQMRKRREGVDALQAENVAQALVDAFAQPPRALVEEILVRPVKQVQP